MTAVNSGGRAGGPGRETPRPVAVQDAPRVDLSAASFIDTLVHAEYTFDDGLGGPDPQGWTTVDRWTNSEVYFHVDDFAGLAPPYTPLSGSQSMWCGVALPTGETCAYLTLPGYGNYWRQTFESVAFPVTGIVSVTLQMSPVAPRS